MKLPDYNDDEALTQWVGERLAEQYDEAEMEHALRPWGQVPAIKVVPRVRTSRGVRVRILRPRGRPCLTDAQKVRHPAYEANREVEDIVLLLDRYYPRGRARMERAVTLAARRAGIKRRVLESFRK